jgi:hypothetical protein
LREAGFDPAHVTARVHEIFAAVQRARVEADPSAANGFIAEGIADLPDTGLWLETLPVEVDLRRSTLSFRRDVPRGQLQFEGAVLVDVQIRRVDASDAAAVALRVRVDWDLPTTLSPRATLRVREHWQLEREDENWVVERFEVSASRRGGGADGGFDWNLDL